MTLTDSELLLAAHSYLLTSQAHLCQEPWSSRQVTWSNMSVPSEQLSSRFSSSAVGLQYLFKNLTRIYLLCSQRAAVCALSDTDQPLNQWLTLSLLDPNSISCVAHLIFFLFRLMRKMLKHFKLYTKTDGRVFSQHVDNIIPFLLKGSSLHLVSTMSVT